jgi:predicted nicotinamide N-methyase
MNPHDPATHLLWQRLLARIKRRYQVSLTDVTVGPATISFARVTDPDRVLDEVAAEEDRREKCSGQRLSGDELHLPYWAELWDSASGIAQFLTDHRELIQPDAQVLDLGCGMGLSGTAAAALGARVLFADLETPALLFAQLNSLPFRERVATRRVDWRRDHLGRRFDAILGADILYERKQWDYLEPFWSEHLTNSGYILLGEPGRQTGDLFCEWISTKPWRLDQFAQPVPSFPRPIRLLRLTRPD